MEKNEIDTLVMLRTNLITQFERLRDWKNNKNAIMKEIDHAKSIHAVIVVIDGLLKDHVNFSDKN